MLGTDAGFLREDKKVVPLLTRAGADDGRNRQSPSCCEGQSDLLAPEMPVARLDLDDNGLTSVEGAVSRVILRSTRSALAHVDLPSVGQGKGPGHPVILDNAAVSQWAPDALPQSAYQRGQLEHRRYPESDRGNAARGQLQT